MFSFHESENQHQYGNQRIIPNPAVPSSFYTTAGHKIMEYLGIGVDAFGFMYQAIKHKSCVQKFSVVSPISVTETVL